MEQEILSLKRYADDFKTKEIIRNIVLNYGILKQKNKKHLMKMAFIQVLQMLVKNKIYKIT